MSDRYTALILGKDREVLGYDDQGTLLLGNGERYRIVPLDIAPRTFRSYTLRAVARLACSGGDWLVDGQPLDETWQSQFASPRTSESDTKLLTAWTLRDVLLAERHGNLNDEYPSPSELQRTATAVAWVEERFVHYPEQSRDPDETPYRAEFGGKILDMVTAESPASKAFKPIFLASFYRIRNHSETNSADAPPSHTSCIVDDRMQNAFAHDVFLSHSTKDKPVVREIAKRLKADGLRVWFDECEIQPGDSIPAKIEEGLEHSRVLVLCMSANAFGSDWAQLEAGTFRFRDPLNKERRFIPLRLDDAPIKGSLAQFLYIDWLPPDRKQAYARLLEACQSPTNSTPTTTLSRKGEIAPRPILNDDLSNDTDDYVRRFRAAIEKAFSAFEAIHAFFFKVCVDYLSLVELIHDGLPVTEDNRDKYYGYIRQIGENLHEMHRLEGRLAVIGANGAVQAMQQYRLQATEVNDMLKLQLPCKTKSEVNGVTEELFLRKDRLYEQLAKAMKAEAFKANTSTGFGSVEPPSIPIGDVWSGLRGVTQKAYSTQIIKGILGRAGLPISKIRYTGTYKGPVLDEADKLVSSMDGHAKDRFAIGCIQEIIAFERERAANLSERGSESDGQTLRDLQQVLTRFGHDLRTFEKA